MTNRLIVYWSAAFVFFCIALGWFFHMVSGPDESAPLASQQHQEASIEGLPIWPLVGQSPAYQLGGSSEYLPGSWGEFEKGRLRPNAQLKVRFDHWLNGRTELSLDAMRKSVHNLAVQDLGPAGGQAVLEIWDIYVDLWVREELAQNRADEQIDTPEKWIATRRDLMSQAKARLGHEWGEVFFAQEEALIQQLVEGLAGQRSHSQAFALPP
jgi:hypothetical protein